MEALSTFSDECPHRNAAVLPAVACSDFSADVAADFGGGEEGAVVLLRFEEDDVEFGHKEKYPRHQGA